MKYLLIALMWTAYCALHSYLISIGFTNLMVQLLKKYYSFFSTPHSSDQGLPFLNLIFNEIIGCCYC